MKYTIPQPIMSIFLFDEEETKGKINIDDLYEKQQKKDLKQSSYF